MELARSTTALPCACSALVIVGVQRCGTTHLARLLDDHPAIEMVKPLRPEPKLFLRADPPRDVEALWHQAGGAASVARVIGEKSTSYLDADPPLERMAAALPGATIIVVLRDPVDRAISHYRFSRENGVETLPPEEALTDESLAGRRFDATRMSASPFAYRRRGRYVEDIRRLHRIFGVARVRVVIFEELIRERAAVADLYRDLGIDPTHVPDGFDVAHNRSVLPLDRLPRHVEQHLVEHFAEANRELELLLGRALPWRRP